MNDWSRRLAEFAEAQRSRTEYRQESLALEIAVAVNKRLEQLRLSRRAFADKLGVSRAYVTQLLGGTPNMTLATMVKVADALKLDVDVRFIETRNPRLRMHNPAKNPEIVFDPASESWVAGMCESTERVGSRQMTAVATNSVDSIGPQVEAPRICEVLSA